MLTATFSQLTEEERKYTWLQQDTATAHTAHDSLAALRQVFGDKTTSRDLW
jgi:hypothetical protein